MHVISIYVAHCCVQKGQGLGELDRGQGPNKIPIIQKKVEKLQEAAWRFSMFLNHFHDRDCFGSNNAKPQLLGEIISNLWFRSY